jgi:hypothetical protein
MPYSILHLRLLMLLQTLFHEQDPSLLGEDPDPSEAVDFLGLAEGEVLHYEALNTMSQGLGNMQASDTVKSILEEEKKHLMSCIQLVRQNASSSS